MPSDDLTEKGGASGLCIFVGMQNAAGAVTIFMYTLLGMADMTLSGAGWLCTEVVSVFAGDKMVDAVGSMGSHCRFAAASAAWPKEQLSRSIADDAIAGAPSTTLVALCSWPETKLLLGSETCCGKEHWQHKLSVACADVAGVGSFPRLTLSAAV